MMGRSKRTNLEHPIQIVNLMADWRERTAADVAKATGVGLDEAESSIYLLMRRGMLTLTRVSEPRIYRLAEVETTE